MFQSIKEQDMNCFHPVTLIKICFEEYIFAHTHVFCRWQIHINCLVREKTRTLHSSVARMTKRFLLYSIAELETLRNSYKLKANPQNMQNSLMHSQTFCIAWNMVVDYLFLHGDCGMICNDLFTDMSLSFWMFLKGFS